MYLENLPQSRSAGKGDPGFPLAENVFIVSFPKDRILGPHFSQ